MKVRVIKASRGQKGLNWHRFYKVQIKTFLIWFTLSEFESIEEAKESLSQFGKPCSIELSFSF